MSHARRWFQAGVNTASTQGKNRIVLFLALTRWLNQLNMRLDNRSSLIVPLLEDVPACTGPFSRTGLVTKARLRDVPLACPVCGCCER
jgi:hypothetical protein